MSTWNHKNKILQGHSYFYPYLKIAGIKLALTMNSPLPGEKNVYVANVLSHRTTGSKDCDTTLCMCRTYFDVLKKTFHFNEI